MRSEVIASQLEHRAWGQRFQAQLSAALMREFPEVTGSSVRDLKYIRQWHLFWQAQAIGQQPVAQLSFEPELAGKLNFYLKAVDEQLRNEGDQPTIGLLLCKSKDRLVAEYALSDIQKPMGLSTYTLSHTLPEALQGKLPSIEQLERGLGLDAGGDDPTEAGRAGV